MLGAPQVEAASETSGAWPLTGKPSPSPGRPTRVRRVWALTAATGLAVLGSATFLSTAAAAADPTPTEDPSASASDSGTPTATSSAAAETTTQADPATVPAATDTASDTAEPSTVSAAPSSDTDAPTTNSPDAEVSGLAARAAVVVGEFGTGKFRIDVTAGGGTFPDPPDLSGATFVVTDDADPGNTPFTCTTASSGECDGPFFTNPSSSYTITQTVASPGFLVDPEPQTFTTTDVSCGDITTVCNTFVFTQAGAYRSISLQLTSSAAGLLLPGGSFVLCAPAPGGPPPTDGCPDGTAAQETGTTDDAGVLLFGGSYLPGPGYAVVQTAAPAGFVANTDPQVFTVAPPMGGSDPPVQVLVTNASAVPAPVAVDDSVSVVTGGSVTIDFLANDDGRGETPQLAETTDPAHGSIEVDPACPTGTACALRYTPAAGYVGPDSFTYTIVTSGGFSNAAVSITVLAAPTVPTTSSNSASGPGRSSGTSAGGSLAYTGVDVTTMLGAAAALIALGSLAVAGAGCRPRRSVGSHG